MKQSEIESLLERAKEAKEQISQSQGAIKEILANLKSQFKIESIDDAREIYQEKVAELEKLDEKIQSDSEALKRLLDAKS